MPRRQDPLKLPSLPKLPGAMREPPGWNRTELVLRKRPLPYVGTLKERLPAGDEVPGSMKARFPSMTLPEWAVWWGLLKNNRQPDTDFDYTSVLVGVGISYYSTIDFLLVKDLVGIEVQGEYWHYGLGSDKEYHDIQRYLYFQAQGIQVVFIDEEDALRDPVYYVAEALAYRDHSKMASKLR